MIKFVRRPAFPGELNHELIWPLVFVGGGIFAVVFFSLSGETPQCLFHNLTSLPCLGCGTTRCARNLVMGHWWQAFKFHPGFFLFFLGAIAWTFYSLIFWLRGDYRRLRFFTEERHRPRWIFLILTGIALHWAWQCYYLSN